MKWPLTHISAHFFYFLEKMSACNQEEIKVVHRRESLTLWHCLLPSKEMLASCPMWMHHKEAASLLNATSVPCPLCSLCMSSRPCPYKEGTAQRGWRGRSLPTGRATTVHRGSEAPTTSAHAVDSATGLKSKFSKPWHTRQAFEKPSALRLFMRADTITSLSWERNQKKKNVTGN